MPECSEEERAVLDALAKREEGAWRYNVSSTCRIDFATEQDADAFLRTLARTPRSLEICPPERRHEFMARREAERASLSRGAAGSEDK